MLFLIGIINIIIMLYVICRVIKEHHAGKCSVCSFKNIFLAGICFFQCYALAWWILVMRGEADMIWRQSLSVRSAFVYTVYLILFLFLFYQAYLRFNPKLNFVRIAIPPMTTSKLKMLVAAIILSTLGYSLGLLEIGGPFGILVTYLAMYGLVASTGLIAWIWASAPKNPIYILTLILSVFMNIIPQLSFGSGRRSTLSIFIIIAWVYFYRQLKNSSIPAIIIKVLPILIIAILTISMMNTVRHTIFKDTDHSVSQILNEAKHSRLDFSQTLQPPDSAVASVNILENVDSYGVRPLFSFRHFFQHYIPRAWWPSKPNGLGLIMPNYAGLDRWGDFNIGPGLVGHIVAEGGWYALIVYAISIAMLMKSLDVVFLKYSENPYFVIAMSCSLADWFAAPRGELGYMLSLAFLGMMIILLFFKIYLICSFSTSSCVNEMISTQKLSLIDSDKNEK